APGLLHGVAVAGLTVGVDGIPPQQVRVGDTSAAVYLRPVVHSPGLRPALLGDGRRPAVHLQHQGAAVVALGLVAVDVSPHVSIDAPHPGLAAVRAAQQPAKELDRVAPHVHRDTAPAAPHVPEPAGVRPVVLLALLDEVDSAEGTLVDQLLQADVL